VDYFVFPVIMLGIKVLPEKWCHPLARLFLWGTKFTKPPFLGRVVVDGSTESNGQQKRLWLSVEHSDGYDLTAAPVVATLLQYLRGNIRQPGLHMQGHLVETNQFFEDLQRMGLTVNSNFKTN
jgi:saccharopine dehydrogenase (NAD+, L-lysine-forming)